MEKAMSGTQKPVASLATIEDFSSLEPLLRNNAQKKEVDLEEYMSCIKIMLKDSDFGFVFKVEQFGRVVAVFATAFYWDFWFNGNRLNVQAVEFDPIAEKTNVTAALREAVDTHWKALPLTIVGTYYFFPPDRHPEELQLLKEWFNI